MSDAAIAKRARWRSPTSVGGGDHDDGPVGRGDALRTLLVTFLERSGSYWTLGVLLAIVLAFSLVTSSFLTQQTWLATSVAATEVLLVALGQTFVIISRGIDLSVGAVLGLSAMAGAWVMRELLNHHAATDLNLAVGALVCIAVGMACGAVNGFTITRLRITPFVATLGMLGVAQGATQLINSGQDIAEIPTDISKIGNTVVLGGWVPIPVLVAGTLAVISALVLHYTRFGRHTYGVGSNPEAAARTGIKVDKHLRRVYVISGAFAGIAGYIVMAQLSVASVVNGQGDELASISAAVIGGASLFGGRGNIAGAVIGTLIVTVLQTGLVIAKVPAAWQLIAIGTILVLAVWADQQRLRLVQRR